MNKIFLLMFSLIITSQLIANEHVFKECEPKGKTIEKLFNSIYEVHEKARLFTLVQSATIEELSFKTQKTKNLVNLCSKYINKGNYKALLAMKIRSTQRCL